MNDDSIVVADGGANTPAASATPEAFDYAKWLEAQPAEARQAFAEQVAGQIEGNMRERLGDSFDVVREAYEDESFRKQLSRLSDKEFRKFTFDEAAPVYETTREARSAQPPGESEAPWRNELNEIKSNLAEKDYTEYVGRYQQQRGLEFAALAREVPEFKGLLDNSADDRTRKLAAHLIEVAEQRTRWDANTRRLVGNAVSYKDVWEEQTRMWREAPSDAAPSIPNTTPSGPPPGPQAPTSIAEAQKNKQRTVDQIRQVGGFANYAKAASGGRRR